MDDLEVDVIIYRTRGIDTVVAREAHRLVKEAPDKSLFLVGYSNIEKSYLRNENFKYLETTPSNLKPLQYPKIIETIDWNTMTGHHDLPVLQFFLQNPDYDNYWVIEDDVRYTGVWSSLFSELDCSNADLLTTTLMPKHAHRNWAWWPTLKSFDGAEIPERHQHRCFNPFARLSNKMLRSLHKYYSDGWNGHYEALWATICSLEGLDMEDIGSSNPLTPQDRRGKHYTNLPGQWNLFPGTFVYRPSFRDQDILRHGEKLTHCAALWHPVKW